MKRRLLLISMGLMLAGCQSSVKQQTPSDADFNTFANYYWGTLEAGKHHLVAEHAPLLFGMEDTVREFYLSKVISGIEFDKLTSVNVTKRELLCNAQTANALIYIEDVVVDKDGISDTARMLYVHSAGHWYVGAVNQVTLSHFSTLELRNATEQSPVTNTKCVNTYLKLNPGQR